MGFGVWGWGDLRASACSLLGPASQPVTGQLRSSTASEHSAPHWPLSLVFKAASWHFFFFGGGGGGGGEKGLRFRV